MTRKKQELDYSPIPEDRGCDIAPRCLSCPLPVCRYDHPTRQYHPVQKAAAIARTWDVLRMKLYDPAASFEEIADALGMTRRSAYRLWQNRNKYPPLPEDQIPLHPRRRHDGD